MNINEIYIEDLDEGNLSCLIKRRIGEPLFIFLGRDPDAHALVRLWAERRLAAGGDPEHCATAMVMAEAMRLYSIAPGNEPDSAPDPDQYTLL